MDDAQGSQLPQGRPAAGLNRLWPLSALNKNLGSLFPSAPLCRVQFCTKCPGLSPRLPKSSL